ncbi:MAG: K(+)-transporting ATPase subunit F [Microcoleus sp. PH2017_10_PVI_O_A]|uniref:K(+)-transporting ATPase subunit F n=1 Tax=unclassified Microcoleus TaxID=2642155 RepID=UPI001DB10E96|nr:MULTISPECIES: K(+)-transporting ATPase subunit F [unclassified Microcoleus]TAE82873.1 MAG: K(+)-transporting ATPase subunit F [Oscillatoriales cyanobacterium]MCC3406088.1 K(+)-transporting ATPase subunit F [Microcoleus sp. PH2017_10_PVI_O_A]MCC3462389.1 K(+)-transporting ATPase subunit F [Microcoleus sp. PH2017_11_PCY_U_A]MCC3478990.1 K(+)-transporting ATPase subunit F [Microcoleus sp. PH2017_12_PCY_D_A]MCC3561792.1 K(+)-transporting ATPase subunit F [Microcoleus sp. PH2017_27_LUM_O_A]
MKRNNLLNDVLPSDFKETIELGQMLWQRHPIPVQLFLIMCFNLIIAPAVYATTDESITKKAAWGLSLLGLVIVGLAVYLFVVIFQPERF